MVIKSVASTNLWLNAFPSKAGLSTTYSPQNILLDSSLSQRLHCHMQSGTSFDVHDVPKQSNFAGTPRMMRAICPCPAGNTCGNYKFLNLWTGHVILRYEFTKIPATPNIFERVN